jgi:putative ABC transport system substrate-binding protein
LRELGYVEGRDFIVEVVSAEGRGFFDPTSQLVRARVDVLLVSVCGAPLDAARRATRTIPIVVATCNDDLVETGAVVSLHRPGGNVTGLSKLTPELAAKRLELLKETFPGISRVAVLWNPAYSDFKADWRESLASARSLGIALYPVEFRRAEEFDTAFAAIDNHRVDALITFSDLLTYVHAKRIADLAAATRLPALYAFREIPDAGGLMSYGPSIPGMWRRAAAYVVRILQGETPADLPIEQPTKFELVINLKTAKTLGLAIPQSVLLRADDAIRS